MADKDKEEGESAPAKPTNWLKAALGTIGGLLSGAVMMYITPLVNTVVKPELPVANFEVQDDGLKVQFHNLSKNGEGLWDFGDGTPLLKVELDQTIVHSYQRAGDYTVKLSLHNAFGDQNDRSVPIHVDVAAGPPAVQPKIVSLQASPVSAGSYAPATFKVAGKVENAETMFLDYGDDRPVDVLTASSGSFEKIISFPKPRPYPVRLVVINGTLSDQKLETVTVVKPPENSLSALLTVTDEAMHLESRTHTATFNASFTGDAHATTCPINAEVRTKPGHMLVDLALKASNGQELRLGSQTEMSLDPQTLGLSGARNLRLRVSDDKLGVVLTGEFYADRKDKLAVLPSLMLPVTLSVQKKSPVTQTIPLTTTLTVPAKGLVTSGTVVLPPPPPDWVDCQRTFHVEIDNNGVKVFEDSQLQRSATLTLPGRKLILTTSQINDQVRIELLDPPL